MGSFSLSGGVEVVGFISPTDSLDTYAVIDPLYGVDGFRNVNLLSDLDLIPEPRRRAGMVVGVSGGTSYYKLNYSPWNYNFSDWSVFNTGGGVFTGGTVTGNTIFTQGVTATTFSASTYLGLPKDIFVTGGTYSNGSITFINNSGGTFNVIGLNTGTTVNLSGGTGISISGSSPNFVIDNTLPDQIVNLSGGTNIKITGSYPNFGIEFTGVTSSPFTGGTVTGDTIFTQGLTATTFSASTYLGLPLDVYTTGLTFNTANYDLSVVRNDGVTLTQNLSILSSDVTITGGTYNPLNGVATFTNNTGGTFAVSGFITGFTDIKVTGFTYQNNTFSIFDSSGNTFPATINTVTGLTVNGNLTVTGNTYLKGLTATTISATTYQNLPLDIFVTGGTYTNGQITFLNNSGGVFTVTGLPIGGAGGQVYYLNLSQTQSPYQEFSPSGTTVAQQTTGITIGNGVTSTIASFQTPLGYPNTSLIPAGYWSFYLHSYKENSNSSFDIFCEVYLRTTGGTETLIVTTDPAPVTTNSPNPSMQLSDGYYSGSSINVSDRIVVKVRATNTSNQSHVITFLTEGTQHYSYGVTPFSNNGNLTCDNLSGCSVIQTIQTNISNKFDKSGGTVTGNVLIQSGLTANTISATTYQNLPVTADTFTTGFTYSDNTFTIKQNNGLPELPVTLNTVTGLTVNGLLYVSGDTQIIDPDGIISFDSTNRTLHHSNGIATVTWEKMWLTDEAGTNSIEWNSVSRKLKDENGLESVNFKLRNLTKSNGSTISFDWENGILTGQTNIQSSTISATTYQNLPVTADTFTSAFTYSNNVFTISRNQGQSNLTALINTVTGLTVNGNLTVTGNTSIQGLTATTISATTYQNLPTDIRVTGGTYTNGTATFTNNTGGTFNVTGFFTGQTDNNRFTTGFTYNNNTFTISDNSGSTYSATINSVTGLTVNGNLNVTGQTTLWRLTTTGSTIIAGLTVTGNTSLQGLNATTISATTYQNLPVSAVTSGTGISVSNSNGTVTITNTSPDQTVTISGGTGITTGGTYPNFTLVNSAPDQTVTISGGTNIQIQGTYPNFGVNFTGTTGSNFTGGTVTGATNFTNGLTANTISATTISTSDLRFIDNTLGSSNVSGEIVTFGGGTGLTPGNLVVYTSTGWQNADADFVSGSTGMLGIATSTNGSDGVLIRGFARYTGNTSFSSLTTIGSNLYVSTNAGQFTQTAPSTIGTIVRVIGYVVDNTSRKIYFCPSGTWIEV